MQGDVALVSGQGLRSHILWARIYDLASSSSTATCCCFCLRQKRKETNREVGMSLRLGQKHGAEPGNSWRKLCCDMGQERTGQATEAGKGAVTSKLPRRINIQSSQKHWLRIPERVDH